MRKHKNTISVIVPTYNEARSVKELVFRLTESLRGYGAYEIIFIDDNSTDRTVSVIKSLHKQSVKVFLKKGKKGKSFSILEGIDKAKGDIIVMIDADLQYPPEAIPEMLEILQSADIAIANRKKFEERFLRKLMSYGFRTVFGRFLFRLNYDIQSGLKAFKRDVVETIAVSPSSGWSFDLELLYRAQQAGFTIAQTNIQFSKRTQDKTKISFLKSSFDIGKDALRLRFKPIHPVSVRPRETSMIHAGVRHKKNLYITHSTLEHTYSALETFILKQKILFITVLAMLTAGIILNPLVTIQFFIACLSIIYFADFIFNVFVIIKSLHSNSEISVSSKDVNELKNSDLPIYSILCPLYREAHVVPQFLDAINDLDWPKAKLDVLFLLEEDDQETIAAIRDLKLPSYTRIVVVPHSMPKTKPKACNYGLNLAKGEYVVIYDAEDKPDPYQLKKAYLGFRKSDKSIVCIQAKLNYYNPHQNLLTRLFTAEYSLWFDVTLTGLQSLNTSLPLGGTSNHFRTKQLKDLQGWDPFNVTEDADLGIRLFKKGFKTAIINSTTLEEANSNTKNWIRQRSRWIKGYMQTYLVHNRTIIPFIKEYGLHALFFHLSLGGKIAFILINPLLWIITLSYFLFRPVVGDAIETLYPTPIFYMAVLSLACGNFMFLYFYMIGCAKRGQWSLIKYVFLVPFYWILLSIAGIMAAHQLLFKPHYWEKTVHGLHIPQKGRRKTVVAKPVAVPIPQPAISPILIPGVPVRLSPVAAQMEGVKHGSRTENSTRSYYSTHKLYINGIILSVCSILINALDSSTFSILPLDWSIISFGLISVILLIAYLLVTPFQIGGLLSRQKEIVHSFALLSFVTATLQYVLFVNTNSVTVLQFSVFAVSVLVSVAALGVYFLTTRNKRHADIPTSNRVRFKRSNAQNILIFNWRDTKHIWAGGAEQYIHEIAKRWVKDGNNVTVLCSNDRHNKSSEVIDGVRIIRKGGCYTVYLFAFVYYLLNLRGKFDIIIDCENGIPFFTPLYVKAPVILLIHHIHQNVFRDHLIFPFSWIAQILEAKLMPFTYKNSQLVTVSNSSRRDIQRLGFNNSLPIEVIYNGVNARYLKPRRKTSHPSFAYLGRLKQYKNVNIALQAFARLVSTYPDAIFTIAGEGESRRSLSRLVKKLNLTDNVVFAGKVSEQQKAKILGQAWAVVQPSQFEGWGITVIESNACGTPVIAANVNGLKDSVVNGRTGLLAQVNNVTQFTNAMKKVIEDSEYRTYLSEQAYLWSQNFSWENSAEQFAQVIGNVIDESKQSLVFQPGFIPSKVLAEETGS